MTLEFAYRIEPGAHMAEDDKGHGAAAYMKLKIDGFREGIPDEKIRKIHQQLKLSSIIGIDPKYITVISLNEYNQCCDDEDK